MISTAIVNAVGTYVVRNMKQMFKANGRGDEVLQWWHGADDAKNEWSDPTVQMTLDMEGGSQDTLECTLPAPEMYNSAAAALAQMTEVDNEADGSDAEGGSNSQEEHGAAAARTPSNHRHTDRSPVPGDVATPFVRSRNDEGQVAEDTEDDGNNANVAGRGGGDSGGTGVDADAADVSAGRRHGAISWVTAPLSTSEPRETCAVSGSGSGASNNEDRDPDGSGPDKLMALAWTSAQTARRLLEISGSLLGIDDSTIK